MVEGKPEIQKRIPGLLETIMLDDIAVELRKMNKQMDKEIFEGTTTSRVFNVTEQEQFYEVVPTNPPWITCSLLNTGGVNAQVIINQKGDWLVLLPLNPMLIDFKGASDRIWRIGYKCAPGMTTTIMANGKY